MFEARLPGFLLSVLLHLGLFALVLFLPSFAAPPPPAQLSGPMILGPVTIGREGKPATTRQPRAEPATAGRREPQQPKPAPTEQPQQPKPVERRTAETPPKPQPKPATAPAVDPNAVALPRDPTQKQPQTNATARTEPTKNATKPPEKTTAETKPADKTPDKPATKPADKPADKPKGDVLKGALADLGQDVRRDDRRGNRGGGARGGGGSLAGALGELGAEAGGGGTDASGDGPGGRGGDGMGILGAYGESVVSRVRPNWTLPGQAKNYTAVVNVKINPDGTVQRASIVRSSGSSYIDSSVIQAVLASQLEPPPAGYSDIDITFNTDQLAQ